MFLKDILQDKAQFSQTECLIANYILQRQENIVKDSVRFIAKEIYGGDDVTFTKKVMNKMKKYEAQGLGQLPICVAKTQYSLSDDPTLLGRPHGFVVEISRTRSTARSLSEDGLDPRKTAKGRHRSGHCPSTTRQGRRCLQIPCSK